MMCVCKDFIYGVYNKYKSILAFMLRSGSDGVRYITVAPESEIPELSLLTIFWLGDCKDGFLLYSK